MDIGYIPKTIFFFIIKIIRVVYYLFLVCKLAILCSKQKLEGINLEELLHL